MDALINYYGGGNKADIKLSANQYHQVTAAILDDRLDDHMMLKFKQLAGIQEMAKIAACKT